MPIPYKVSILEDNGTELPYQTELLLSSANTVFAPTTATTNNPANTATNAQTAIVNAQALNNTIFLSSTTDFAISQTQTAFLPDPAFSIVPPAGTWLIMFSASSETSGVNVEAYCELFVSGVGVADSIREVRTSTAILGLITLSTSSIAAPMNIITQRAFNGTTDTLTVRTRIANGTGNYTLGPRSFVLLQVKQ